MKESSKLIQLEAAAIGERADSNNVIKYNIEYGLIGQPWCVMFQWCKFKEAGLSHLFYNGKKTASCKAFYKWALAEKLVIENIHDAKPGDIIIFSFRRLKDGSRETSHMGLCYAVDNNYIYTIDGNTSEVGNEANGMKVMRRNRGWDYVLYVIRPKYNDAVIVPDSPKSKTYVVQPGDYLSKIAARYNTSVAELLKKNPQIKNPNLIFKGQVINL